MSPDRVTREQLVDVFGTDAVRRIPAESLPGGIAHEPTRRFLTEIGLPTQSAVEFIEFDKDIIDGPKPLQEAPLFGEIDEAHLPVLGPAYYLGDANGSVFINIVINGATGEIFALEEGYMEPYLMNTDIESLVFYMYVLERDRELYGDEYYEANNAQYEGTETSTFTVAADRIEREWREHDAAPFEVPPGELMRVWVNLLDDIASGTRV